MNYNNIVIDDLREFINTPPAMQSEVIYLRSRSEYTAFADRNHTMHINHLWLDFDLGNNETTSSFLMMFIGSSQFDTLPEIKWSVDHIYIVSGNPVGRRDLFQLCEQWIPYKTLAYVNPVDFGLINEVDW